MPCSVRILITLLVVVSLMVIYVAEANSILSILKRDLQETGDCAPVGAVCGGPKPCCNKCRVNWGGAWCS
ncbi:unnamed protein product [Adineta ricciae]|uniref:Uncharacterized protein n=1 Tax=Adineta ricciae TaxID=249248 RepID=A0A814TJI2_ADIRI|nr:unnamed protein product [Adineta ricciae]